MLWLDFFFSDFKLSYNFSNLPHNFYSILNDTVSPSIFKLQRLEKSQKKTLPHFLEMLLRLQGRLSSQSEQIFQTFFDQRRFSKP